ncbi:MAG: sulfatase, partial [Opitutia bacterium TMED102]
HHHKGFTLWMAGGGLKRGISYGATDELGMHAVQNPAHIHDIHATVLHLLGLDHERLTFRHNSRDVRLTDVFGNVLHEIVA